ncbi:leucyl/phenylalanyl-tRNA--protein transferase [Daejeonia sp. YH14]|uniref:leucyl/phenylalanyl-tRNA--protein transferase n=1 Tax=Daejeonia sp. YH14 TaxID=3439042 RepID=UPI003F499186
MIQLHPDDISFPDPRFYDGHDGLIAYGGDLSPERLWFAYQNGIFPWFNPGEEILWWCPDPRFVLFPKNLKVSKSMKKILRDQVFFFTENQCFEEVMRNCMMSPRKDQDGTWISEDLISSFVKLHQLGKAKSIEVWQNGELVGGFYGLVVNHVFCGESMFAKVSNASKAGFIWFIRKYSERYSLIDCQVYSEHLASLGAEEMTKRIFLEMLQTL